MTSLWFWAEPDYVSVVNSTFGLWWHMDKVTKSSVNYREAKGDKRCGNCFMYRPSHVHKIIKGSCTLVEGVIDPDDTCDKWERK